MNNWKIQIRLDDTYFASPYDSKLANDVEPSRIKRKSIYCTHDGSDIYWLGTYFLCRVISTLTNSVVDDFIKEM